MTVVRYVGVNQFRNRALPKVPTQTKVSTAETPVYIIYLAVV